MRAAQIGIIASQGSPSLSVDIDNVQTFSAETFRAGDRAGGEVGSSPSSLYVSGKSVLAYPAAWDGIFQSFGFMTYYDKNNGFYPAPIEIGRKGGEPDRHIVPLLGLNTDESLLVTMEKTHSGNINANLGASDLSEFPGVVDEFSIAFGRHNIYRTSSGFAIIGRAAEAVKLVTCDDDGGNMASAGTLIDSTSGTPYLSRPFGTVSAINGKYYIVVIPVHSTGTTRRVKFVLVTEDFVTYSNIQETHSFVLGSVQNTIDLESNGYAAIGALNGTSEVGSVANGLTPNGQLFIFSFDYTATTSEITTSTFENGEWVHRVCDTGFSISSPNVVDLTNPTWCCCRSASEIYLMLSISGKPHLIKTLDKGATWADVSGDMLPDKTYYRGTGPFNNHDIPENENFVFWFIENLYDNVSAKTGDLYAVKAAFGSIQSETATPFTEVVAELTDIVGARYIFEADNYDVDVTGFFDKSGSGRTGAKIGTPALLNGAVTFNGINQGISIGGSATDFDVDDKFSLAAVAKWTSGDFYLTAIANTSSGVRFCYVAVTSTGLKILYNNTANKFQSSCAFDATVFNIIQVDGDGNHFRVFVNGVELAKAYQAEIDPSNFTMSSDGRWGDNVAPANNVRIASVGRSSSVFFGGGELKACAYYPDVLSRTNRKKQLNFLSTKYSISVTNNVE